MKIPTDATVEFRCDCGDLIGWIEPREGRLRMMLRDRMSRSSRDGRSATRGWGAYWLPADMSDLRKFGMRQSCGRHQRHIIGDHWDAPRAGSRRRKVIVSTIPPP